MCGSGLVRLWALGGALLWHVVQARLVQRWLVFAAGVGRGEVLLPEPPKQGQGQGQDGTYFRVTCSSVCSDMHFETLDHCVRLGIYLYFFRQIGR